MFFVLSKLLLIFILPLTWILFFLIVALIVKKEHLRRRYLWISFALLFIFTIPYLLNSFAGLWDIKPVALKKSGPYSCAIVLGGFSGEGANGEGYFTGAADRFIEGIKLFNTGKVSHILITGGNGSLIPDNFSEGTWAGRQLKLFKVPDSCILVESRSRNTIENAAFSKPVLEQNHLQPPYLLVTSAFHMRRAQGIFKKTKIDVIPYPCNYLAGPANFSVDQLIPDAGVLGGWNFYIKEAMGTFVNLFK
jgi:uncharacterized SAM-binding protein YcdF (DUF218 family)